MFAVVFTVASCENCPKDYYPNLGIETEKKMKKKVAEGLIDRELQVVSPELLLGYEMKNLCGRSLREMNISHAVAMAEVALWKKMTGPMFILFWSVVAMVSLIPLTLHSVSIHRPVLLGCILLVMYEVSNLVLAKKLKDTRCEAQKHEKELRAFVGAVDEMLDIDDDSTPDYLDEKVVRASLLLRASKVLKVEEMFEEQIDAQKKNVEQIVGYGNWLIENRREVGNACRCAETFGLDVDIGAAYGQARRQIKK